MPNLTREAMYWYELDEHNIHCQLCPNQCIIPVGKRGVCRSRYNYDGTLYAVNYAQAVTLCVDPIEKKPLYHYYPGSRILSTGPNSCNLGCFFCQNYQISQEEAPTTKLDFQQIADYFSEHPKLPQRLAITYTEPFTWYEFIYDLVRFLPEIRIVLITNGYINPEPLQDILPFIDAMNVDLKSIREDFYKEHCSGTLDPVLNTIRMAHKQGVHLEVTNLIIPGLNDADEELEELAKTLAAIDTEIPLHLSAYHPAFKSDIIATSHQSILLARKLAQKHLRWVYAGNLPNGEHSNTLCDKCGEALILRAPGFVQQYAENTSSPMCPNCKEPLYGRYERSI